MEIIAEFQPNKQTEQKLERIPDDVLFAVARQTLDLSIPIIPLSVGHPTSGSLRRTSAQGGVRSCDGGYYIGSFTDYASYVWMMDDETTNWTTSGTHSQWYARTLKEKGKVILENAVNQAWKDEF